MLEQTGSGTAPEIHGKTARNQTNAHSFRERRAGGMDEVTLKAIENDHKINRKTDSEFLYAFQKAVLLALLEDGTLTEMQYRYAAEKLRRQNF